MAESSDEVASFHIHHKLKPINNANSDANKSRLVIRAARANISAKKRNFDHKLLETQKSGDSKVVTSASDILVGCGIENNEQKTANSGNHKQEKQKSVGSKRRTVTKQKPKNSDTNVKQNGSSEWYECDSCDFKSVYKHSLILHFDCNHVKSSQSKPATRFRCEFCKFKTRHENSLKEHYEHEHRKNAEPLVCFICNYKTRVKKYLIDHVKYYHDTGTKWYQCQFCQFKTKYETSLEEHEMKHKRKEIREEEVKWFQCDSCEFKSTSLWCLECHSKYSHSVSNKVVLIESKTVEKTDLSQNSNENDTKRDECTKRCEFKVNLISHLYKNDAQQEWTNYCELKPVPVLSFSESSVRQENYVEECVFEAEPKTYITLNSTENYVQQDCPNNTFFDEKRDYTYSGEIEPLWYQCNSCEFKSTSQWYLEYHSKYSHSLTDEFEIEKI